MKIYLAGPMRGKPEFNFPTFFKAAKMLRDEGHEVFSPAERDISVLGDFYKGNTSGDEEKAAQQGFSLREALAADMKYIAEEADTIALLPGWESSSGARAEHALSVALGHRFIYLTDEYVA